MAHFAKLDETNTVLSVHVLNNNVLIVDGTESEAAGAEFLTSLHGHALWKQCSYNKSFRKNYPAAGWIYDPIRDAFYEPQPFPSWTLNETSCIWEPPIPRPFGTPWVWNEDAQTWDKIND